MNDFTKEELETLNTSLSIYENRLHGHGSPTPYTELLRKIGSMIDNYTEFKIPKVTDYDN